MPSPLSLPRSSACAPLRFDSRPSPALAPLPPQILVAQKVFQGVCSGITVSALDELAAQEAAAMTATHYHYAVVRRGLRPPFFFPPRALDGEAIAGPGLF